MSPEKSGKHSHSSSSAVKEKSTLPAPRVTLDSSETDTSASDAMADRSTDNIFNGQSHEDFDLFMIRLRAKLYVKGVGETIRLGEWSTGADMSMTEEGQKDHQRKLEQLEQKPDNVSQSVCRVFANRFKVE